MDMHTPSGSLSQRNEYQSGLPPRSACPLYTIAKAKAPPDAENSARGVLGQGPWLHKPARYGAIISLLSAVPEESNSIRIISAPPNAPIRPSHLREQCLPSPGS